LAARLVPKRYNEGWGLWHGKIYGFDDDVVLSGANLSRDYFTNRQDRYIAFRGHAPLADYFHALMQRFKQLSFTLEGYSTATASPRNFDLRWISKGSSGALGTATTHVAQPNTHPRQYTDSAKRILGDFLALYARKSTASLSSPRSPVSTTGGAYDTTLQPFLQMGAFDIKQETDLVVPEVLRAAKESADVQVDWTSGYFSLRKDYRDALLAAKGEVAIVFASPEVRQ
jgi:CDP-diacylglycerol--glycerol-3-phosphate 3-phosphatidyltransferase